MGPNGSHRAATWLATDPLKRKEPDHWATSTRWLQHDSDGVELTFEDLPLCDRCYEHRLMERFNELHYIETRRRQDRVREEIQRLEDRFHELFNDETTTEYFASVPGTTVFIGLERELDRER